MEEIDLRQRSSSQQDEQPAGVLYERPVQKDSFSQFKTFCWNSKERKLMGKTGRRWCQTLIFYFAFYAAICALFAACWCVFYKLLDLHEPYRQLADSRIGKSPGLSYRPTSPNVDAGEMVLNINSTFKLDGQIQHTNDIFEKQLHEFLTPYYDALQNTEDYVNCDHDTKFNRSEKSCLVRVPQCAIDKFSSNKPCILIKLNKIYGWEPEYYDDTEDLYKYVPQDLVTNIHNAYSTRTVWISCEGQSDLDKKNLGDISYLTERGFPGYYYPFVNTKGYLSPLVAVQFQNPKVDTLLNVECRAWAKNIHYESKDGKGLIRFQIYIHSKNSGPRQHLALLLLLVPFYLVLTTFNY